MITPLLLSLFFAPTIDPPDFAFQYASEAFVIDSLAPPSPVSYRPAPPFRLSRELITAHVPPAIAAKLIALDDDCWHCRERARKRLQALGSPVVRWMFWGLRSTEASIRYNSWLVIREIGSCGYCHGSRQCDKFSPGIEAYSYCIACGTSKSSHEYPEVTRECKICVKNDNYIDPYGLSF